jgi:DTW domain-containing protein YfiP
MDLKTYQLRRQAQAEVEQARFRSLCATCLQPHSNCYCAGIKKFDCKINFVILIHPIEVKRRIATGRMSHLCLENSHLLMGQDYSENRVINDILQDPQKQSVILYPGLNSLNLTEMTSGERSELFLPNKDLCVFVIDGTWNTARKMLRLSHNLHGLPRVSFVPSRPSNFQVRKQPREGCYSTIEAIHETIELLGPGRGYHVASRQHDNLLEVFDGLVRHQLQHIQQAHQTKTLSRHRLSQQSRQEAGQRPSKKSA